MSRPVEQDAPAGASGAPSRHRGDPVAELDRDNRATGVTIDHRTILPRWAGLDGRVDYAMALQSLADLRRGARSARDP